jgi:2-(1,2-epoxy-1,2-dihydrophenyl)acetyl-CoA isomerase
MGEDFINVPGRTLGELVGASMLEHFNPMVSAWYHLRVPVVVAVNGIAAGAGMSLALVGDIVLAAHSATFVQLFAPRLGLMPDLGLSFHMPRLIGIARAKGLALLGDALPAAEAERWGLIWRCVEDDELMAQAEALVRRLGDGPTQAFARIKRVYNEPPASSLTDQLAIEASLQGQLGDTKDFAEGVQAFRGKRPPRFCGE